MMRYCIAVILNIFLCNVVFSQEELKKSILSDLKKASELSSAAQDSAVDLMRSALWRSRQIGDSTLVFKSLRSIGYHLEDQNRLLEARNYYAEAMKIAESHLSDDLRWKIYTDWAILHKKQGIYKVANEYHLRTIEEAEEKQKWETVENGYHGLGTMYSMMSDFDKSIKYYLASIKAAEKSKNMDGIILSKQNISNIYLKAHDLDMASKNIEETYKMALERGDSARIGAILRIYGQIEMGKGNLPNALLKMEQAKEIYQKKYSKSILAETLLGIAVLHLKMGNLAQAKDYFDQSERLQQYFSKYCLADFYRQKGKFFQRKGQHQDAINSFNKCIETTKVYGFKEIAKECHLELAQVFKATGNFQDAYHQMQSVNGLNDSLFMIAKQKNMTETNFKYDVGLKDLQIQAQNKALRDAKTIHGMLAAFVSILLLSLFFLNKQVKEKQQAVKKTELLMKELHHRVKNNLQTITSVMRMQSRQITDPIALEELNDSRSRLETISLIHQQLYKTDEVKIMNFRNFLEDIIDKYCFAYKINPNGLKKNIYLEKDDMSVDDAMPLGLLINELLTNTFKYGMDHVAQPEITIDISAQKFAYSDNGPGYSVLPDKENIQRGGFGLQLVTSLAEQIKGSCRFFNDNGAHFEIVK